MPAPLSTPGTSPSRSRPWRRRRHRKWARLGSRPVPEMLLSAIPSLPRAVLARLTERMIDRIDEIDGDPDFEDSHDQEAVDDL